MARIWPSERFVKIEQTVSWSAPARASVARWSSLTSASTFWGQDGGGVFLTGGGEDHGEHALGEHGEVVCDVGFEAAVVVVVVCGFDGVHVGVGAADEDVVEEDFVGAGAVQGFA